MQLIKDSSELWSKIQALTLLVLQDALRSILCTAAMNNEKLCTITGNDRLGQKKKKNEPHKGKSTFDIESIFEKMHIDYGHFYHQIRWFHVISSTCSSSNLLWGGVKLSDSKFYSSSGVLHPSRTPYGRPGPSFLLRWWFSSISKLWKSRKWALTTPHRSEISIWPKNWLWPKKTKVFQAEWG